MKRNTEVADSLISEKWFRGITPDAKAHLLSSLNNLREGAPTTPTFKLYGKSDWSVVTDFLSRVSSESDVPQWLIQYELSRKDKYGPQGGHAPWDELKENAEMYFNRLQPVKNSFGGSESIHKYSSLGCQMLSSHEALLTLKSEGKIQTRAAGWRAFNLKKTDHLAQRMALEDLHSGNWRNGWAYFFSRYNKKKKRLFIPMPFSNMIGQAQYFAPFLRAIQRDLRANTTHSAFTFWADKIGFDKCFHLIMEPRLRGINPSHVVYIMRDFDKMDTTTGPSQKRAYFIPRLREAFRFGERSQNVRVMEEQILFSNSCPIATPDGMWTGDHGEASGATVTNGGETCCNEAYDEIFQMYLSTLASRKGIKYRVLISVGNGDDGMTLLELNDTSQFDQLKSLIREAATLAARDTGFIIQAEKWDIHLGDYGKYCQYLVTWNGSILRAMYPAALILNSICNPEKEYKRDEWDKDYRDIDIIMRLTNGVELPYFHQLVDYVDNGMKYRLLGRTEEATRRILSKWDNYRALRDSSWEYNMWSDGDQGLARNPVVLYLLEKRGLMI